MTDALDRRLTALDEAVALAGGRLDPERVDAARRVVRRAGQRLGLGVEATVVALAGPTGAGKSSLFNALSGADLADAGRRRPTTSATTAAVWGDGGDALLDWLEVPRRHRMGDGELDGLLLLDLPDFDSVQRAHRDEVDRVLELADLAVWVADPQKYADAALHDRYLKPLAGHGAPMLVVLNQSDLLAPDALRACRADLGRLLREDGLDGVGVLAVSAATGAGLEELHAVLARSVAAHEAAVARLGADVSAVAAGLAAVAGCDGRAAGAGRGERAAVLAALEQAAGVPAVVHAVAASHRRAGSLATGWPFVRWVRRLRAEPLRRLHLGSGGRPEARTSLPPATPAQRSQVGAAARTLAAGAATGLPEPWPALVRSAALRAEEHLPDRLDREIAGAELERRRPRWWGAARAVQTALAIVAGAGALWLLALVALGYLQLTDAVPTPKFHGFPIPTLLLLGGLLAGLLVAGVTRWLNAAGARRRAGQAHRELRRRVEAVARAQILDPVAAELEAREGLCRALERAAGKRR